MEVRFHFLLSPPMNSSKSRQHGDQDVFRDVDDDYKKKVKIILISMIINITVVMITIFIDIFIVASPKCSFHVLPNFLRFCNLYATRCCHYCIYMQFISTNDELMFLNIDICNSRHWGTWTEAYQWKPCDDIGLWWKEIHFDMWISPSPASWMHYIYQCETYQKNQQDIQKPMQEMIKKMSQSSSKL